MVNIDYYLGLDYESLKSFLLYRATDEERHAILSDSRVKKKLILPENEHELTWLCNEDKFGRVMPLLLSGEGIEYFIESEKSIAIFFMLAQSHEGLAEKLLSDEKICSLILEGINKSKYYFGSFSPKQAEIITKYALDHDFEILDYFGYMRDDCTLDLLNHLELSRKDVELILPLLKPKSLSYVLETTVHRDILSSYEFPELSTILSSGVVIPTDMINNKSFIDRVSTIYDPRVYRFLINSMSNPSDREIVERARKKYYEDQIYGYDRELKMTPALKEIYQDFVQFASDKKDPSSDELYNGISGIFAKFNLFDINSNLRPAYFRRIYDFIVNNDLEGLKTFFQEQSNALLTDMIIDYSFEEVYDNVFKDLEQLLHLDGETEDILDEESRDLYSRVLRLDDLPYEEKIALLERLKSRDCVQEFYDYYLNARTRFEELVNSSVLNEESIQRFRSPISDELGVDVYVLDGEPFYALVKSIGYKGEVLEESAISMGETTSMSIISSEKLSTFVEPSEGYNLVYSALPSRQTIHTYPVDSFTGRGRNSDGVFVGSNRVNQLMTPEELVRASTDYNEILVSQRPSPKNRNKDDEVAERLEDIPVLGLLCYDEITEKDVESARNLGCSIVCVKTKRYTPYRSDTQISMYDRMVLVGDEAYKHFYVNEDNCPPRIDRSHSK